MVGGWAGPQAGPSSEQIVAYACGNGLALAVGAICWSIWFLLADFREPILWALVFSVVLRDLKDLLVAFWTRQLSGDRSLVAVVAFLAISPMQVLSNALSELGRIFKTWHSLMTQHTSGVQEQSTRDWLACARHGATWAALALECAAKTLWMVAQRHVAQGVASHHLFKWLLWAIALHEVYAFMQGSWLATWSTLGSLASLLVAPTLLWLVRWYLSTWRMDFLRPRSAGRSPRQKGPHLNRQSSAARLAAAVSSTAVAAAQVDRGLRHGLRQSMSALVTGGLILGVLLGPLLLSVFVGVQIGREGRAVIVDIKRAMPANWTLRRDVALVPQGRWEAWLSQEWVAEYQAQAADLARRQVPLLLTLAEERVLAFAESHNLTQAVEDVRMLYRSVHPTPCTPAERTAALVDRACAGAALHAAQARLAAATAEVSPLLPESPRKTWCPLALAGLRTKGRGRKPQAEARDAELARRLDEWAMQQAHEERSGSSAACTGNVISPDHLQSEPLREEATKEQPQGHKAQDSMAKEPPTQREEGRMQDLAAGQDAAAGLRTRSGGPDASRKEALWALHGESAAIGPVGRERSSGGPATSKGKASKGADAQPGALWAAEEAVAAPHDAVQAAAEELRAAQLAEADARTGTAAAIKRVRSCVSAEAALAQVQRQEPSALDFALQAWKLDRRPRARGSSCSAFMATSFASNSALLQVAATDGYEMLRGALGGSDGEAAADLTVLQRLANAAAEPLKRLGQASWSLALAALGSTSSVALSGGLGIWRLGAGFVTFGLQFLVFVGLLYFLLDLAQDPLTSALDFLPLSPSTRREAQLAFGSAMRGVFVTPIKSMAFHALFTWLALRAFRVHLVWTCTIGVAVLCLVPILPVWLFVLPGVVELLAKGHMWSAGVLLGSSYASTYADDVIMGEIPDSNSYLMGMGLAGGLTTFANPVKGALFGPLLISLVSALYNLHSRLQAPGDAPPVVPGSADLAQPSAHSLQAQHDDVMSTTDLADR